MAIAADELAEHDWVNLAELRLPEKRPFLVTGWQAVVNGRPAGVDRLGRVHHGDGQQVRRVNVICIFQRTAAVIAHEGDPLDIRQVPLERVWLDLQHGLWKVNRELRSERRRAQDLESRLEAPQPEREGGGEMTPHPPQDNPTEEAR